MPNPNPFVARAAARAARAAQLAAAVTRARQWLDTNKTGIKITYRETIEVWPGTIRIFAAEYAAATGLHPRTARRHLEAALKQEK